MLHISLNKSYNDDCSICMEDFDLHSVQLKCNHTFHSKCIIKYIEVEYKKRCKQNNTSGIYCKQFKCPLCRTSISCIDINNVTYKNYKEYKTIYKNLKNDVKNLQTKIYLLNIKFSIKKIFKHIKPQEAYTFIINGENLLESISQKKIMLLETKIIMKTYQNIYYSRCICCANTLII
jgi:hypothetical protein